MAIFPVSRGKNRKSLGVEDRGSLISVPQALAKVKKVWDWGGLEPFQVSRSFCPNSQPEGTRNKGNSPREAPQYGQAGCPASRHLSTPTTATLWMKVQRDPIWKRVRQPHPPILVKNKICHTMRVRMAYKPPWNKGTFAANMVYEPTFMACEANNFVPYEPFLLGVVVVFNILKTPSPLSGPVRDTPPFRDLSCKYRWDTPFVQGVLHLNCACQDEECRH